MRKIILLAAGCVLLTIGGSSGAYARHGRHQHSYDSESIVAHPAGCPRSLFCGCGAAVEVFGTPRRELWLASNWLKYPRTAPAPGMVAARRGHVMVLREHVAGSTWIVFDANSGKGKTRVHARDISPYVIVNPHG